MDLLAGSPDVDRFGADNPAVFLIVFTIYSIAYRIRNKRFERKESERMGDLRAKGVVPDEKHEEPAQDR